MLTDRFGEALAFAFGLHRDQYRKGTSVPYVSHLLAVTALVLENGGGEDEAIAALLHDAIEDQGDSYLGGRPGLRGEIESRFGNTVLNIVNGCTDDDGFSKSDWRGRKQAYLDHIRGADLPVRRVSCADKLHNARSVLSDYRRVGNALWTRFRTKNPEDHLWYFNELANVFTESQTGSLAEELCRATGELNVAVQARLRE
jgi:(p)ppGpp synthase/HD superfamily hydrolase